MAEPFEPRPEKRGRLPGFGASSRKRAFLAALETELASVERVTQLDAERVQEIALDKGIDLDRDLPTPRRAFYRKFLEYCLNDHALSGEESDDLQHLQQLLRLSRDEVRLVHDEVARSIYGQVMDVVLADYRLDPEEEEFLQRLSDEIGISETTAAQIRREGEERARQRFVSRAVVHGSPLLANQGTEIELEGSSNASLEQAVEAALESASQAVGTIRSAELKTLRVDIGDAGERIWSARLTTRLHT